MKKFNLNLKLLLLFMALSSFAFSQRTITGTITDAETTEPLIGAAVVVTGTTTGGVTDIDGKFQITAPKDATTLTVSYTGYDSQVIPLTASNVVDVQLKTGKLLNEVVVIGYGTQKKKDLTGSIVSVSEKNFQKGNIASADQLVAGKIAGVAITSNGGAPGAGSTIRIRGGASLIDDKPLIVVDGIPLSNSDIGGVANGLSLINPNDIESFTVLKDASAAAIYGSRASNGVLLITTKKGKKGEAFRIGFSSVVSLAKPGSFVPVLTGDELRDLVNAKGNSTQKALLGKENTNWQSLIYRDALSHDENLVMSGTIAYLPYRASVGYLNQNGILKGSNMSRVSPSLNINPRFAADNLKLDLGYKGSFAKSTFADQGAIGGAVFFDPTQTVYSGKEKFQGYYEWLGANGNPDNLAPKNPLGILNSRQDVSNVQRHLLNAVADYRLPFFLDVRVNISVGLDKSSTDGYTRKDSTAASAFAPPGVDKTYTQSRTNKTFESYVSYSKEIKKFRADVMAGYGYQDDYFEGVNNVFDQRRVRTGDTIPSVVTPRNQITLVSFFGRANFGLMDKYLLTFTVRRDGSSKLAPGYKWITYPAAALAWRMSDDGIGSGLFSNLKARIGYGVTGQQEGIEDYNGLKLFSLGGNTAQYPFGNNYIQTIRPEAFNEQLSWQKTTTTNFGIDFTTKNERISGGIDYFVRQTSNLFATINLPAGANFSNRIKSNIGTLESNGVEVTLNTVPVKTSKLNWEANFVLAYNKNKITKLNAIDDPKFVGFEIGGISGGVGNNIQLNAVGVSKTAFYVYQQVYAENGKPIEGVYVDRNGDGKITVDDKYLYQKPDANYTMGFTSNLTYNDFSFGFVLRGSVGNYMYSNVNSGGTFGSNSLNFLGNPARNVLETGFVNAQYFSDYYIQNASFLKMDNLTFGYNLSSLFKNKMNVQLTAVVQNVLTITKYTGLDPEIFGGIDNNIYLRPRTYSLGINVNF